jgi:predicted Zn-dependent peptidase
MEIKTLKNGLKMVFYNRPRSKVSTFAINVRAGSDDETRRFGISHYVEHACFTGTTTRKGFDIVNEIEGAGGHINAGTSEINTMFYASIPSTKASKAIDVVTDIIVNPTFKKEDIDKERGVVLSEEAYTRDNSEERTSQIISEKMLGRPSTIGTRHDLQRMTRGDIVDYHATWYVPNNMTAIIIGPSSHFDEISGKLSMLSPSRLPERPRIEMMIPEKNGYTERRGLNSPYVSMVFPTSGFNNCDVYSIDLVSSILDRPMSGRLNVLTRLEKGLVYFIACKHAASMDYGMLRVVFSTKKTNVEKCREATLKALQAIDDIDSTEMRNSKNYINGSMLKLKEDSTRLASQISLWDSIGDVKLFNSYIDNVNATTISDIKGIKEKYLSGKWFEIILT